MNNSDSEDPLIQSDQVPFRTVSEPESCSKRSSNLIKTGLVALLCVSVVLLIITSTHENGLVKVSKTNTAVAPIRISGPQQTDLGSKKTQTGNGSDKSGYKNILMFSDFYDNDRNWYLGTNFIDETYFERLKCPQTQCVVTSNRKYLPGGVSAFDALLFFAHNAVDIREYPSRRRPEQLYVVGMLETPPHTWRKFKGNENYFNWTMSYLMESDVFWPYGYFVEKNTDNVITPSQQPVWRQMNGTHEDMAFLRNETLLELIKGKSKMAAWFVSNCNLTPSKRMNVAKSMQKLIPVDIYGGCGTLNCTKDKHSDCQKMLERDYKFYLSFENSLCQDYITEKVYSNMNYYIIPVVYNGADNHRFLPPHSYIDVLDYSSIEELTDHMQFLADHPEEYIKYFWWKEFYYIRNGYNFCDLCVKLHERHLEERRQYYHDLDIWYRNDVCRETPQIPLYNAAKYRKNRP